MRKVLLSLAALAAFGLALPAASTSTSAETVIIKKHREGQYVLLNVSMTPATTADLERNIRFQENIIRHMLSVVA